MLDRATNQAIFHNAIQIYLASELKTLDGNTFKLAGILPITIEMTNSAVNFVLRPIQPWSDFWLKCLRWRFDATAPRRVTFSMA